MAIDVNKLQEEQEQAKQEVINKYRHNGKVTSIYPSSPCYLIGYKTSGTFRNGKLRVAKYRNKFN